MNIIPSASTSSCSRGSPPPLGQRAEALIRIRSEIHAPDTKVVLLLPGGFELVEGASSRTVSLDANSEAGFRATVRSVEKGEWTLEASAESHQPGVWARGADVLYVLVLDSVAYVSDTPFTVREQPAGIPEAARANQPVQVVRLFVLDTFLRNGRLILGAAASLIGLAALSEVYAGKRGRTGSAAS